MTLAGRERPTSVRHRFGGTLGAYLLAVALGLVVHSDYGVTWDEGVQAEYGEAALEYYGSLGARDRVRDIANLRYYGTPVEALAALAARLTPERPYRTRHLVIGLFSALGIAGLVLLGRVAGVAGVGGLAALMLILMPAFTGHAFNNSKDAPFAGAVALMLGLSAWWVFRSPRSRWSLLAVGLSVGLALAIRPGSLPIVTLLFAGCTMIASVARDGSFRARQLLEPLTALALGWVFLVLTWPYAHGNPIAASIEAVGQTRAFFEALPVLFEGAYIPSDRLPWDYLPRLMLLTTPLPILALALIGLLSGLRGGASAPARTRALHRIVWFWLGVPLALILLLRPPMYDGLRHVLFLLPPLAMLAALGADAVARRLAARAGRTAACAVIGLVLLWPAFDILRLHPYQVAYYNPLAGGVAAASHRYETDFWASAYTEAMEWINRDSGDRPTRVLVAGLPVPLPSLVREPDRCWIEGFVSVTRTGFETWMLETAAHRAGPNVEVLAWADHLEQGSDRLPDYYLGTTRYGYDHCFSAHPIVHEVSRAGARMAVVRRLR